MRVKTINFETETLPIFNLECGHLPGNKNLGTLPCVVGIAPESQQTI